MLPNKLRRNPGRIRAIIYAVLVNAVVIGLAVIGFRWTMAPSTEEVIQAVAVPEAPARKPEEPDKRAQQEEEARKKAEEEKRRQDDLKKQQAQEEQRKEAERKKIEAAQKQKEMEIQKQQKEKEQQKRAAALERQKEEKLRQEHAEQSLQEQLAAEEKARQQAAQAVRAASEVDKYKALIRQRVSRSWNRPVGVTKGLTCVVHVRLTPGGEVLSATVTRSSGNAQFDRSVEYAVYKAAPLPLPEDPTLFDNFREIEFTFDPDKELKK